MSSLLARPHHIPKMNDSLAARMNDIRKTMGYVVCECVWCGVVWCGVVWRTGCTVCALRAASCTPTSLPRPHPHTWLASHARLSLPSPPLPSPVCPQGHVGRRRAVGQPRPAPGRRARRRAREESQWVAGPQPLGGDLVRGGRRRGEKMTLPKRIVERERGRRERWATGGGGWVSDQKSRCPAARCTVL
jgi:hypothetical protein